MISPDTPRRRWFSYSLRTFFVVLTIFGVWLGVQVKWIRDRHEAIQSTTATIGWPGVAPLSLRVLGEKGAGVIGCDWTGDIEVDRALRNRIQRLFPEADVVLVDEHQQTHRP